MERTMFNDQHVKSVLERYYPKSVIRCLEKAETKFIALQERQKYADASFALRRLAVNVDGWPIPPAGLFVVEERTVYLRSTTAMTVCHEAGHALDCALGGGFYLSGVDPRIRRAFASATAFVTPYAASACDEYFAEAVRAWTGANDDLSLWPRATRERLQSVDPRMAEIVANLFAEIDAKYALEGEQMHLDLSA
jgi:hypothetical protein